MTDAWIDAPRLPELTGAETFRGLDATVQDFWAFAMSDLRVNNVRGYLAEFLVARAVGAQTNRVEWDAYDVLTPSGVRVEVKSAGYLQAWPQRRPSRISFSGLTARTSTEDGTAYADARTHNADVYVFAVQTATSHDNYNPLDVNQWDFYVLPRQALEQIGFRTVGLTTLRRLAGAAVPYAGLAEAIALALRT